MPGASAGVRALSWAGARKSDFPAGRQPASKLACADERQITSYGKTLAQWGLWCEDCHAKDTMIMASKLPGCVPHVRITSMVGGSVCRVQVQVDIGIGKLARKLAETDGNAVLIWQDSLSGDQCRRKVPGRNMHLFAGCLLAAADSSPGWGFRFNPLRSWTVDEALRGQCPTVGHKTVAGMDSQDCGKQSSE